MKCCVFFKCNLATCRFRTCRIFVPAIECVTGTSCICRQRDLGAIRLGHCLDVLTFTYFEGKCEISAVIVDLEFLIRIIHNLDIRITARIFCIWIAVDIRCYQ